MGRRRRASAEVADRPAAANNRRPTHREEDRKATGRKRPTLKSGEAAPSQRSSRHPKSLKRRFSWLGWTAIGLPVAALTFLVAIAPSGPKAGASNQALVASTNPVEDNFRYLPDKEVFAVDFDPRKVSFGMLEGWDREQEAYNDSNALAFVSGPMYERYNDAPGQDVTVPLGDIKLGNQVWRGRNRTAARQRAFIGINHQGRVDFGYGDLTDARAGEYDTFIGGLHALYNDMQEPPSSYKGAYSVSMGQQIRYFLPRIRMVMGLRADGRLEVFMSRDGLTLEQTKDLARSRGLVAAYMPDHASKSRFIVPGVKGFNEEDANWISGGATSFVHVPYMLKLEQRPFYLQGNLLANLSPLGKAHDCGNPLQCSLKLGGTVMDRALAGLNRLMEQGVVPLARMVWSPSGPKSATRPSAGAPLREPPITADPSVALNSNPAPRAPELPSAGTAMGSPVTPAPLPPDLPAPETFNSPSSGQAVYDPSLSITAGSDSRSTPAPPVLPPAAPPALQESGVAAPPALR